MNDIEAVVKYKLLLYADDSAILVSGRNKSEIESFLSCQVELGSQWLIGNKLHLGKSESFLFEYKHKLPNQTQINVSCNGHNIQHKDVVKYLGLVLL